MLVHTKDYDCSTDYRILNLLKPIYKVVGLTMVNAASEMSK